MKDSKRWQHKQKQGQKREKKEGRGEEANKSHRFVRVMTENGDFKTVRDDFKNEERQKETEKNEIKVKKETASVKRKYRQKKGFIGMSENGMAQVGRHLRITDFFIYI